MRLDFQDYRSKGFRACSLLIPKLRCSQTPRKTLRGHDIFGRFVNEALEYRASLAEAAYKS